MSLLCKILGIAEIICGIAFTVFFLVTLTTVKADYDSLITSSTLILNGFIFYYIGTLGTKTNELEDMVGRLKMKIEKYDNAKIRERIENLENKVNNSDKGIIK